MRSLFKSPFNSPMRSPTAEEAYAFKMHLTPGALPYDEVTNTKASCSISGVRYGIVNGVVSSFASNMPPVEDKGLRGCPAFTQLAKYTEDLTNAAWATARSVLSPAGTYNGSNRWKITEDTNINTHNFAQVSAFAAATDNNVLGVRLIAEFGGRHLAIFGKLRDNTIVVVCTINLITGIIENLRSGCYASAIDITTNTWDVFVSFLPGTGANSPFLFWGLSKEDGSTNYGGDGISGIYVSRPTLVNFGVNGIPFIPPYVPNYTSSSVSVVSEAATSTTGTSFDLDLATLARLKSGLRGPNAQGHIELEVESNVDSGWLANNTFLNILSINNDSVNGIVYKKDGAGTSTFKGIDSVISDCSVTISGLTVGQTFRISLDYGTYTDGTQKMRLTVNGVKSIVVAFSGSFGTQDLRLLFGDAFHVGYLRNLSYSERPVW